MATSIIGQTQATLAQAQTWAQSKGASTDFVSVIIPLYFEMAPVYGIRPDVAVAQSAKETRYGQFGGVVERSFNNWCGLKTTSGGSNSDPNAHTRFDSDRLGVMAHLEHLFLYAVRQVANPVDPRHFASIAGTAKTVEALGGKWAPSTSYGTSIINDYLKPMLATVPAQGDDMTPDERAALHRWMAVEAEIEAAQLDPPTSASWAITLIEAYRAGR